ncbi:MAG: HD-GYP domain-containing protein [Leptolinea sp.]|nr:HD-GYP domain-containing protein [Leptolinea sp.]
MNRKAYKPHPEESLVLNKQGDAGRVEEQSVSVQVMIPMELDPKMRVIGFFALDNEELPEGSQKNLNEITGTPFKAELAGLTVFVGPVVQNLQDNYIKALFSLADSIDRCDQSAHSQTTALWSRRIAQCMQLSSEEVEEITLAARLHDVGKAVVPREILVKPGPLSENEWSIIRHHADYSATLMDPSPGLKNIKLIVLAHHEYYNGCGYPRNLRGEEIPQGARILAVADAYSTMTTGRAYRPPISPEQAKLELMRCSGTQFDPEVVKVMIKLLGRYQFF